MVAKCSGVLYSKIFLQKKEEKEKKKENNSIS